MTPLKKQASNITSIDQLNNEKIKQDFAQVTQTKVNGKDLVYLDNAATTLKPKIVTDAINRYNTLEAANIHRGVHFLSEHNTSLCEDARSSIKDFINASESAQVLFTRGTTESLNLIAQSYGRAFLKAGDEIIVSEMEHHSNIVPWQMLCEEKGCVLKVIPMNDDGELIFSEYLKLLNPKTKLVSVVHVSNALGTINPIKEIINEAHKLGAVVSIDGAQAVAHTAVDVQDLDCDFYSFSAHKIFGPTGVGVLYGKRELLDKMPPVQGGGDMIDTVTFEKTTYNVIPHKFEAGTPHISGIIGFGAAIKYVQSLGIARIAAYENELLAYATKEILKIEGVRLLGTAKHKGPVLTFVVKDAHPHDLGTLIDMEGVAIRTGHHCAQPVMLHFGISATARASFSIYNDKHDIDTFINALIKVKGLL